MSLQKPTIIGIKKLKGDLENKGQYAVAMVGENKLRGNYLVISGIAQGKLGSRCSSAPYQLISDHHRGRNLSLKCTPDIPNFEQARGIAQWELDLLTSNETQRSDIH